MLWWMALTRENPLQLVRIRDEVFGYSDMSEGFLRLIVIDGGFEADLLRLADAFVADGGVFLDVGANYGFVSLGLAGRHGARVEFHLFEPIPRIAAAILASARLQPAMRLKVNQAAVTDHEGVVSFRIDEGHTGASYVAEDGMVVTAITLDRYLERQAIDRVAFLKMDVEGHELVALRGAARSLKERKIQAIYFEYCEKWLARVSPPDELPQFLHACGYAVCFCRAADISTRGAATHTIRRGLPGHGVRLLPVAGHGLPPTTDLLAVPMENLEAVGSGS